MNNLLRKHYSKKLNEYMLEYYKIQIEIDRYENLVKEEKEKMKAERHILVGKMEHYLTILSILESGAEKDLFIINDYRKKLGMIPLPAYKVRRV